MSRRLRILHLEDQPNDRELVRATLESEGIECRVVNVATEAEFVAELSAAAFDVVLSDFALPGFDGLSALRLVSSLAPETPFILVSGTLGEDAAIESLRSGATDYVLKDRLNRLGPALERALQQAGDRRERRTAELALLRERHFLRAVLESTQAGLIACDAGGRITLFNRAAREIHGLPEGTRPEALPGRYFQVFEADGATPIASEQEPLVRILRGEPLRDSELVIVPAGTVPRRVLARGRIVIDELGARVGAVLALLDVSEQRSLSEQLRQAQKMEAIGRLAGGVAHDFNNLLTVILGHAQLLSARAEATEEMRDDARDIAQAATRAAGLTRQLLAFSRQQVLQPRVLDLNAVILETEKMLRRLIGEDVELRTCPAPGLDSVRADPGQIEQVLMNLAVNARDAMPEGGRLTIETANAAFEGGHRGAGPSAPGRYVMLGVTDTGTGMDAETASHIFEPFFTTKPVGKGTGLGLSTVHGIVAQSGGHIEVKSAPGLGTTFRVYLPSEVAKPAAMHLVEATPAPAPRGSARVLVVEDDELVRGVVSQALRVHGYHVLEARDRQEAIALCAAGEMRGEPVELVLTDVVMPGIGIAELIDRLHAAAPRIRILCMSGYTDRAIAEQGVLDSVDGFVQKPFSVDDLLARVVETLKGTHRRAA